MRRLFLFFLVALLAPFQASIAQPRVVDLQPRVVDLPTRPGVTQRFLYSAPENATKAVILFSGGQGILQILSDGSLEKGKGNFLVRSRKLFADQGLAVAVIDAPSDRQSFPFLADFRDRPEHAADVKAVIAWIRQSGLPVWLIGTSRGTQSVAYVATQLPPAQGGPDGLVLTATILTDSRSRPVPAMALDKLSIPVLVVHHEDDGCSHCAYRDMPRLMEKLAGLPQKELISFRGGASRGDPCEAFAYHGFNGLESEVVAKIAAWIKAH
jgi:hypothetical protein